MIKLDEEYFITADNSFVLHRKYKGEAPKNKSLKTKEVTEQVLGYYGSISHLLNRYRKEQMLKWIGNEKISLEQLCDRINEMDEKLMKKLKRLEEMDINEDTKPRRRGKNGEGEKTGS